MADWSEILASEVERHWSQRKVFLIAQVKPLLKEADIDVDSLLEGRQVRAFLSAEAPFLRQLQHEHEPTNWGLVPSTAEVERPYEQYFLFKKKKIATNEEFPYQNALRVAFGRPIPEGTKRWVSAPPVRFVDLPDTMAEPGGIVVSDDDLVVGAEDSILAARISAWIDRNRLSPAEYRATKSSTTLPKGRGTALHQILDLIPLKDQHRVIMPLDIIHSLLAKPGDVPK